MFSFDCLALLFKDSLYIYSKPCVSSVGYFVAGNDQRGLIPQKAHTVNINFRSHAGVLNAAGGFLGKGWDDTHFHLFNIEYVCVAY